MTAVWIVALIAALLVANSIVTALRDIAVAKHTAAHAYPRQDGDFALLGPEIFTDRTGDVISWKGANYARQKSKENEA